MDVRLATLAWHSTSARSALRSGDALKLNEGGASSRLRSRRHAVSGDPHIEFPHVGISGCHRDARVCHDSRQNERTRTELIEHELQRRPIER